MKVIDKYNAAWKKYNEVSASCEMSELEYSQANFEIQKLINSLVAKQLLIQKLNVNKITAKMRLREAIEEAAKEGKELTEDDEKILK